MKHFAAIVIGLSLTVSAQAAVWTSDKADVKISKDTNGYSFVADIRKDGTVDHQYQERLVVDANIIPTLIKNHLIKLAADEAVDLSTVITGTIDSTKPVDALSARAKFLLDIGVYRGMLVAVQLGLIQAGDKSVSDQLALVKSEWDVSYAPLLARFLVP